MDNSQQPSTPFSERRAVPSASKGLSKTSIFASVAGCLILLVLAVVIGRGRKSHGEFRTLEVFPVSDFLDNYEMLLGNKFKLSATVDAELGTEVDKGKLVVFRDGQSKKVLPVLIPSAVIPTYQLSKSQKYTLVLEVTKMGILTATNLEKE